ncbi:helix-turn-helix transcriptional regulator [Demequina litorisediminis]|uniref:HTH cro/C1-type domain-containing protein n=1 Tax=Demequina litorisediminis TaxID=1849022 RepID=A0ABQ6I9F3_9MICO|nr:hypothetical protein GCM10025876_05500 [Demequina litorisediminis]
MSPRNSDEVKAFLSSRRARVTPEEAGLPAFGGRRRVAGLRREEVAMLAGVSADYYVRLERGNLAGASDSVLDALATALRLDEAEREHLFDLARAAGPARTPGRRADAAVPWSVRTILDGMTGVPAWVRNDRHDIIAANLLGRALYSPLFDASTERPVNTTKFTFLDPGARTFWRDYEQIAHDGVAMLQMEAGRHPHDKRLITLVGEALDPLRGVPAPLGIARRHVAPQRPQAAAPPCRGRPRPHV